MLRPRLLLPLAIVLALVAVATGAGAATGNPPFGDPVTIPPDDFPDPFVLRVDQTWFAYGTDGDLGNVQVLRSDDLVNWTAAGTGNAYGGVPSGFQGNDIWAPAVYRASGGYVLYYAARNLSSDRRCIIATTSDDPAKFTTPRQLLCNDAEGGVIDPDIFVTVGGAYLLWKTEGVPGSVPPALWSQPLSADGLSLTGSPSRLLSSRYPWEGTLIENPTMVSANGRLFLFYSGNEWESAAYAVGWAVCDTPQGPCVAPPGKPLLSSESGSRLGPGGGTVFQDERGFWWLGYAAWIDQHVTEETGHRKLFFRRLDFGSGRPALFGANGQPAPQNVAERIAGANRFDTAAAFSAKTVQVDRPVTYVATGAAFPDALASGPASGLEGSPVLLVGHDDIPASVRNELARVSPGHIVVMGGTGAISDGVYSDLAKYSNGSIHREPGNNRYDTAARVSKNTYKGGAGVAYVATGENFADALAGGAAGARNHGPLLLVTRDGVPQETADELARLHPGRIVVLGGQGAVSDGVAAQLGQYGPVTRIAGSNRYDTAAKVATQEFSGTIGGVVVATGQQFPDAVAAGAAGFPILLVPSGGPAPAEAKDALRQLNPLGVVVLGGQGAVPDDTLASLLG